ncbi:MAG: PD40 domain-containing protein [Crocinitomicaceae bacterium]|nr:PD40 domain-containing protein [Crocinitomicaceae bacterium]
MRRVALIALTSLLMSSCASLYIKNGKEAYQNLQYQDAIWSLEKGLQKKDDPGARRMLAESYLMVNDYRKANEQYERINTYTDNTDRDRILQGQAKMTNGQYTEARTIFEGIVSRDPANEVAKSLLNSCKKLEEMKKDSMMYIVNQVNIPGNMALYSAYPFKNGLILSSPASKGDRDPYTNRAFTDLYFSNQSNGAWSSPEPIENVNSKYHDAVAAVSPNGQTLVFTRSFQLKGGALAGNDDGMSNTQLYYSKMGSDGKWGKPEILPFSDPRSMYAHPAFTPDGKTLYFSSDRPGGKGKMDIYQSSITETGWGEPTNLGSDINTPGDELFPTVRGNDILYFSSDAHQTLGGYDINFVEKNNGVWGPIHHMSYPVNTANDDFSLVWNPDGATGYFTSDRSGIDRIYSLSEINPKITLKGLILGKESSLPLGGARITVQNLSDGTEETLFTDGNGNFSTQLTTGKDYKVKSELDGYFSTSEDISTKGITEDKELKTVIEMQELYVKKDEPTVENQGNKDNNIGKGVHTIPNIFWDYNKWDIRVDAEPYLNDLVKLFRENQNLKFELASHCDSRGSFEYNDDLSSKRAKAVVDYLVKKGVPRSIMVSQGYGERKLINGCSDGVKCSEEQHQQNRRTEFTVIDKK